MKVIESFNKNNFIIENDGAFTFQSYDTLICEIDFKQKVLKIGDMWDYSATTSKHFYKFLENYCNVMDLNTKSNKKDYITQLIKTEKYKDFTIEKLN